MRRKTTSANDQTSRKTRRRFSRVCTVDRVLVCFWVCAFNRVRKTGTRRRIRGRVSFRDEKESKTVLRLFKRRI